VDDRAAGCFERFRAREQRHHVKRLDGAHAPR
jgi:hypothetical protein